MHSDKRQSVVSGACRDLNDPAGADPRLARVLQQLFERKSLNVFPTVD